MLLNSIFQVCEEIKKYTTSPTTKESWERRLVVALSGHYQQHYSEREFYTTEIHSQDIPNYPDYIAYVVEPSCPGCNWAALPEALNKMAEDFALLSEEWEGGREM